MVVNLGNLLFLVVNEMPNGHDQINKTNFFNHFIGIPSITKVAKNMLFYFYTPPHKKWRGIMLYNF